jgi:hypothetical protein
MPAAAGAGGEQIDERFGGVGEQAGRPREQPGDALHRQSDEGGQDSQKDRKPQVGTRHGKEL